MMKCRSRFTSSGIPVLFSTVALLSLVAFSTASSQPWQLRYTLDPGVTRFKRVDVTTALAQSNDGRSTTINRITTRYYTMTVEPASDGNIHYVLVQDTAIVEDSPGVASTDPTGIAFQNILTGKRFRAVITPAGTPVDASALDPIDVKTLMGPTASESILLQEAFILPTLPERTVTEGLTWTESRSDTLFPTKQLPGYGTGDGVRLQSMRTTFRVGGLDGSNAPPCLSLEWQSTMLLEDQTVYEKLEDFTETVTTVDASMCFDTVRGALIKSKVKTNREGTRALFGDGSSVVPSSTMTEMTLTYLPS